MFGRVVDLGFFADPSIVADPFMSSARDDPTFQNMRRASDMQPTLPCAFPEFGIAGNRGQGATASLASTATPASWNL
jgi:hypothetical protein